MLGGMRILDLRRTFIHTHFVTDARRLPSERVREIERGIVPVLRQLGIVVGVHLAPGTPPGGIEIVLECIPAARELERIERSLRELVRPIPIRPPTTQAVVADAPGGGATPARDA